MSRYLTRRTRVQHWRGADKRQARRIMRVAARNRVCGWRTRLPGAWEKVPCGRPAGRDGRCAWHPREAT